MAIRFSPGCGCCGCETATLRWVPSSPLSRGEYTDSDRWRPFTEYLKGDKFWELSEDQNGDTHAFLFTVPETLFSGGGWTLTEEARYSRGRGISYFDGLEDFYIWGTGWSSNQIVLHEQIQSRKMKERQGIVSRRKVADEEWLAKWTVEIPREVNSPTMEMDQISLRILFMGSVTYEPSDSERVEPTRGIASLVTKCNPRERLIEKYDEDCIPWCEAYLAENDPNFDISDLGLEYPRCGPQPPFDIDFKIEHGTFKSSVASIVVDQTWTRQQTKNSWVNSRSNQPIDGTVVGELNVPELLQRLGQPENSVLDLHDPLVQRTAFFFNHGLPRLDPIRGLLGFRDPCDQNKIAVVTGAGRVKDVDNEFEVKLGDTVRVADLLKTRLVSPLSGQTLEQEQTGAYEHTLADEVIESGRTCFFGTSNGGMPLTATDTVAQEFAPQFGGDTEVRGFIKGEMIDIEVNGTFDSFDGGRLAFYIEEFRNDGTAQPGDRMTQYEVTMPLVLCTVETPASVKNPECVPIPAYECNCRNLDSISQGMKIASIGSYDPNFSQRDQFMQILQSPNNAELGVFHQFENDEWWLANGDEGFPMSGRYHQRDCLTRSGQYAIYGHWRVYSRNAGFDFGGRQLPPKYYYEGYVSLVLQINELAIFDCLGFDRFIMARSAVNQLQEVIPGSGFGLIVGGGDLGLDELGLYDTAQEADDAARSAIVIGKPGQVKSPLRRFSRLGQGWLCSGAQAWNRDMTADVDPFPNIAASRHSWELIKNFRGGESSGDDESLSECGMVVTLTYPDQPSDEYPERYWEARSFYEQYDNFINQDVVITTFKGRT